MNLNEISESDLATLCCEHYYNNFMYYEPHPKQLLFHKAGKEAKERLFLAGNRTGKTYCGSAEVCIHAAGNYPED